MDFIDIDEHIAQVRQNRSECRRGTKRYEMWDAMLRQALLLKEQHEARLAQGRRPAPAPAK